MRFDKDSIGYLMILWKKGSVLKINIYSFIIGASVLIKILFIKSVLFKMIICF